ncbi:MAG: T9SS type A sorting domain-containing protein [Bacteroidales bacterium]|nr:T9SS type A sorting domain-containing protein [Bacteroidales bacterium]
MKKALLSLLMGLLFMTFSHAQENFANPIVIGQLDSTYECGVIYTDANNTCAFIDDVPNTYNSPDVVYQFTLANPGKVNINTCNNATNYDSYLRLYNETFSQIAFNDDGCENGVRSKIEKTLSAGTYYIVVEGWSTSCGNYHLEVSYKLPPTPVNSNLPDLTGNCSIVSASAPEANSFCAATIIGTTETVFPILSSTVITWIYDDGFGNIATQTQNAIINDSIPPVPDIASLPDVTEDCEITTLTEPTATDNCGTTTVSHNAVLPIYNSTTITWTYTDVNGNSSTQTQNAIIIDTIPPVPDIASLPDVTEDCEITTLTEPTATDNCTGEIIGVPDVSFPITTQGPTVITWTFTDENGNSVTQTQNLILNDTTQPVPDLASLPDIEQECAVLMLTATATDNCVGTIVGVPDVGFPITTQGTTVITWTFTDENGNSVTQTQNVTINDVTPPIITCPADILANTDPGLCGAIVTYNLPEVEDNCNFQNLIVNGDASDGLNNWVITQNGGNGWNASEGVFKTSSYWDVKHQVIDLMSVGYDEDQLDLSPAIFISEDYIGNGTPTDPYQIKVELRNASNDVIASFNSGIITCSPDWQTISHTFTGYGAGLRFIYFEHGGRDVENWAGHYGSSMTNATVKILGQITQTAGLASNSFFPVGTTTNTFEIADAGGNTSTCSFDIVVTDNEAPIADIPVLTDLSADCEVTSWTAPTATDNCSGSITGVANQTLPIQETTSITWSFEDENGNISTQTQEVIINDAIAPVLDAGTLEDISADCEVTSLTAPTATDNCSGIITGIANQTLPIQETTTITWTFEDANGNSVTQTQEVIINDVIAPVPDVDALSDITTECAVTMLIEPTATDNCAGTIIGVHDAALPITTIGTTLITWTFTDGNGNSISQTQNVIISGDNTPPVADLTSLPDIEAECEVINLTAPTATDNCGGLVVVTNDATLPIVSQGTTVVTWTYTDEVGNSAQQTQNVVIDDITGPVADIDVLADITADCEVTSLTEPTATDNCGGLVIVSNDAVLPINTHGTTVVTWTYTDGNGNTTTQTQNVVIEDITGPVADISVLSDVTSECEVVSLIEPTATDNCGGLVTVTNDATLPITTQGTTVVTWTYEDNNGNSTTQTQNVVIEDVTSPIADIAVLEDITAECEVTSLTAPTATDNCFGIITGITDQTLPIQETTTITWTFEDGNGNTTTQTQNVVIDDAATPVLDIADLEDVTAECEVTSLTAPTATDNCAGTIIGTHDATFPITTQGTTLVTWTFTDGNGNSVTQTQNVIINDATLPILDVDDLADITAECEVTSLTTPTATDNCVGEIQGVHNTTLPITTQGTTVVTWTFTDENGNSVTQTQNVVINDVTAPSMTCPTDITTNTDMGLYGATVTYEFPTATDNCSFSGANLIANGDASDGLNNWIITQNGGNGWNASEGVFKTSYMWCRKYQIVDLLAAGYSESVLDQSPEIFISEDYQSGYNATDPYYLNVELRNASNEVIAAFYSDTIVTTNDWQTISHTFAEYGEGLRYIYFEHGGTDVQAWGGFFGAYMTNATVKVAQSINQIAGLPSNSFFTVGTTTNTFEVSDAVGNTSTCSFDVIVVNNNLEAPVPNLAILSDIETECEVTNLVEPTATDNIDGEIIGVHNVSLPITAQGTTVVTWTYTDSDDNIISQTQNVIISADNTPPVADLALLPDIEAECEVTSLTAPTATDNCGGLVTVTNDATLPITTQGTTVVTWTYTDEAGNSAQQTQNVIISTDNTPPVADLALLPDIEAECEVVSLIEPTATDNCGGLVTVTNDATLPISTQGTTVVTWTYEDNNGNSTTQTQNVVIEDITGPVADISVLSDVTAECEITSLTAPTATDNCGGLVTVTNDATLPITTQGTTVVTWTYTDGNGNSVSQTQNIVIEDVTAPVPDLDELAEIEACFELATLTEPSATDNCGDLASITHDATLPITTSTTIIWTFTDGNGNTSTQTQSIVINTVDVSVTDNSPILIANAEDATYQWVDCDNANNPILGETNQTFIATENGNYAVEVTQNGCTATSDCINVTNVDVNIENTELDVNVYPNPTSGLLFIEFTKAEDTSWKLVNITGQVILEGQNSNDKFSVNMEDLAPGVYTLNIQQNDRIITKRVVRK